MSTVGQIHMHICNGAQPKMLLTSEPGFIHPSLQVMDKRSAKKYIFNAHLLTAAAVERGWKKDGERG